MHMSVLFGHMELDACENFLPSSLTIKPYKATESVVAEPAPTAGNNFRRYPWTHGDELGSILQSFKLKRENRSMASKTQRIA